MLGLVSLLLSLRNYSKHNNFNGDYNKVIVSSLFIQMSGRPDPLESINRDKSSINCQDSGFFTYRRINCGYLSPQGDYEFEKLDTLVPKIGYIFCAIAFSLLLVVAGIRGMVNTSNSTDLYHFSCHCRDIA